MGASGTKRNQLCGYKTGLIDMDDARLDTKNYSQPVRSDRLYSYEYLLIAGNVLPQNPIYPKYIFKFSNGAGVDTLRPICTLSTPLPHSCYSRDLALQQSHRRFFAAHYPLE